MRMGDVAAPVDGKTFENHQDGTEISWNNCLRDSSNPLTTQDNQDWKVSFSPHRAFIKNHKGDGIQSIEPCERSQRDTFLQKSNWKDLVEATSPIVSSILSKSKDQNPSTDIDVMGAAVQKLTSDAENLAKSKNTEPEKQKGRANRAGDNVIGLAKQTTKSKMIAEINKRRRAKIEEERRTIKQSKDDSSRSSKSSCTVCGVSMPEGPRTICRSCLSRQRRDKSKDKAHGKDTRAKVKSPPNLSPKREDTCTKVTDSQTKVLKHLCSPPTEMETMSEESPMKNRSLSMDITDTDTETNTIYSPHKRTNTDLGPNFFSKSTQDKSKNEIAPKHNSPRRNLVSQTSSTADKSQGTGLAFPDSKLSGIGTRVMKRSTTDSEIVSRGKLVNKPIANEDNKAAMYDIPESQQLFDDNKKRASPKYERKDGFTLSTQPTSQENANMGMKLERSKTVMGKMNSDNDKKTFLDLERTKKKEGSNLSAESEKSYTNKKFVNPPRSHTIIGDGHNKRQKNKGDWAKSKGVKTENGFGGKDAKKKMDKKSLAGDDDGRRVSFVEGDTIKKLENEDAIIAAVDNTMPLNLYDYIQENESSSDSDSNSDTETASIAKFSDISSAKLSDSCTVKLNETPSSSRTEIPEAIRSRGINVNPSERNRRTDSPLKRSESNSQLAISTPSAKYGQSNFGKGGYDSESGSNFQISRWSEEATVPAEHEAWVEYEAHETDDEEEESKENNSKCSYSENSYRALGKNEEIEYETDAEDSDEDSMEDIYTEYPSKKDENDQYFGEQNNLAVTQSYFTDPSPYTDHNVRQNDEDEEVYTTIALTKSRNAAREEEVESHIVEENVSPTQAEYTETSYSGHWAQAMIGNGDSAKTYFNAYETDVDTGLSVLHPQNENEKPGYGNGWGFSSYGNDSSSSSDEDDDHVKCSDSWYTGGYYDKSKSDTSVNNDDLIYFNDRAGKRLSESELYTGEIFSNVVATGNCQTNTSKNNNITLEDNLFEGSNFWIISSRPQMHQMKKDQLSRTKTMRPYWGKGHCNKGMLVENLTLPVCNVSNNNNDDDECKASCLKGKFPVQIACKSDYTEYTPELLSSIKSVRSKKDVVLLGNKDFTKYDRHDREDTCRDERVTLRNVEYLKTDTLFFGDEPPRNTKPQMAKSSAEHNGLYFNKSFTPIMCADQSPENARHAYPKDEDYQGGFFYATRYESNNNSIDDENNNNNYDDYESDSYTGCFRNEEEYKPTHDGLFNSKASSFVFQKRAPEPNPVYFCNVSSKSYYDAEESVYAFEKKIQKKIKPPEVPKIMKVGSIVVRNNVECEVDYAQNIDMDSQDVPKTWMRYDYGGDADVADTSSYAQNVSFEEFGGAKPWVMEGCRAPWKLKDYKDKKGKDEASNKNGNGSWKPTPDNQDASTSKTTRNSKNRKPTLQPSGRK